MHSEVNIWTLVKNLLHKYNCVIVPGLGGFIAHQESALIDPVSGIVNPPFKHITFNAQLTLNDGLLVTQVADYLKIDYIDAIKIVDIEILNFNQLLKNNSQLNIVGLGNFILNNSGKLLFTPEKSANFLIQSFGLESVKLNQASTYKTTKIISSGNLLNSEKKSEKQFITSDSSNENTNDSNIDSEIVKTKKTRNRRKGLTFTAIGTFLILVLGLNAYIFLQEGNLTPIRNKFEQLNLGSKIKSLVNFEPKITTETNSKPLNTADLLSIYNPENTKKEATFNNIMFPEFEFSKSLVITENSLTKVSDIEVQNEAIVVETKPVENIEITSNKHTQTGVQANLYYIIAGAFKSEQKADKFVNELNKDGFKNAAVLINPDAKGKGLKYYVTYSKHTDLAETISELNNINENENPDAWIFESHN
ncbi:MAG: SPOR domain-containing protein [Bacteroidia bacterium]